MTTLTRQNLQAQIISDPAQAAALRELLGGDAIEAGNIAIVMLDGDTLEGSRATVTFDNAPGAAYVPTSDADARGLDASTRDGTITTTDGYQFTFDENQVRIDWPGREGGAAETIFRGNQVTESDGTTWEATDGNYILPNGAMFTLDFEEDGTLENFTLVHGDHRVDVGNLGDDPHVGRVREGGYAYRMDAVEQNFEGATFRMGGYNDYAGEGDVAWNVEHLGQHLGVMTEDGADPFAHFVVDESLRPEFGTQDYERMLRSQIEDIRSVISGGVQSAGGTDQYGDLVADYLLGSSGTYDQYAQALQQSVATRQDPQAAQLRQLQQYFEQMFAGMPQTQSWDQGMQALTQLMQMWAQSQGMQTDYAQATSNLRGYIPSAPAQQQPSGVDAAMLVDQIINGVGEQQRNGGNRSRLEAFDLANGGYQGPARRGADDSVARLLQRRVEQGSTTRTSPRDALDVNEDTIRTAVADLKVSIGDTDVDESHLERLASLPSAERLAILTDLTSAERNALGVQLGGLDEDDGASLLASLVRDAEDHGDLARPILEDVVAGMDESDDGDADDILRKMQADLAGGDIDEPGNRERAAAALANAGDTVLQRMSNIHGEGVIDGDELETLGAARGQTEVDDGSDSAAVSALLEPTLREVANGYVKKSTIDAFVDASPEDRASALSRMTSEERQRFFELAGRTSERSTGALLAGLVRDVENDTRVDGLVRDALSGIEDLGNSDNILQRMQRDLGGGDIDETGHRQQAAQLLALLEGGTLDAMEAIHRDGYDDTDELRTLEVARLLQ